MVRHGAQPQRAGRRPADLSVAHADSPIYFLLAGLSGIERPEDLKAKRSAWTEYRLTVGLWARGILQEHYGVRPEDCHWFTNEPESPDAGFQLPANVEITCAHESTEAMLLRGELDALIPPNIVPSFRKQDPRIRRVFKDIRATVNDYFHHTRIFPITHTLVVRRAAVRKTALAGGQPARSLQRSRRTLPQVLRLCQALGISLGAC